MTESNKDYANRLLDDAFSSFEKIGAFQGTASQVGRSVHLALDEELENLTQTMTAIAETLCEELMARATINNVVVLDNVYPLLDTLYHGLFDE